VYEVGTAVEFPAWHLMPGVEGPEGTLHEHDYRLELVVSRDGLDDRGMVCDLDLLEKELGRIADLVRGRDLERIRPADVEAVTVEVFARWAHDTLAPSLAGTGVGSLLVRVWESPTAFGGYQAPV
jgi:6-pyruvoyl-tetrahydropterin synthase